MRKLAGKKTNPLLAGLLAWLVPGVGHWYLGRPTRGIILFLVILGLFWSGIAIGGAFTVNPREEAWWWRAQMFTGISGVARYYRQASLWKQVQANVPPAPNRFRSRGEQIEWERHNQEALDTTLAKKNLALVVPGSDVAYILSGVAGMLNLMCIFDVVMLSLMGRYGEPRPEAMEKPEEGRA